MGRNKKKRIKLIAGLVLIAIICCLFPWRIGGEEAPALATQTRLYFFKNQGRVPIVAIKNNTVFLLPLLGICYISFQILRDRHVILKEQPAAFSSLFAEEYYLPLLR